MIEIDRKFAMFTYVVLALVFTPRASQAYNFDAIAQAWEDEYLGIPIDLHGRVVDEGGESLEAQLSLIGFGDSLDNDGEATNSYVEENGTFDFVDLARTNVLMVVEAPGFYPEIIAVDLQQSEDEVEVDLGEIVLYEQRFDRARLTFGGDVMFARRYFDDLLHMDTLEEDTVALFRFVEPVLHADDLTSVNLETPVTADLSTPHPVKSNVFNAYPESADALEQVGIDAVTLGNNHVFDYLAKGTLDTLGYLDQIGMPWFGAGANDTQARQNWWDTSIGEIDLAMQGFCDNRGDYGSSSLYVTAANPNKPGSLWSSLSAIDQFFDDVDGRFAIPQFHGGREYAYAQTSAMRDDFEAAIDRGAGFVIGHHPHVVHGVTSYDGGDGPRFVFGSLGNFVFDQRFWETFSSYLVSVDLEQGQSGVEVARVRLIPMHLDGYVPRLLTGVGITELGRYVAHLGTEEQIAGGFTRTLVFAEDGRLLVTMRESDVSITDMSDQRIVPLSNGSTGPVPLDPYDDNDALARISTTTPATCELGFDRLRYGDFEDRDVDDQAAEGDRWEQTFARYIQRHTKRSGQAAAVLLRNSSNTSRAGLETIADVPVTAGRRVSITGWSKGSNAGKFEVKVEFKRSSGSTISTTTRTPKTGGTWDWQAFTINLTAPANTETVELTYYQSPPKQGEGLVFLDDLELLEWDTPTLDVNAAGVSILTPNGWDAVRCSAAGASLNLTLTHRVYETPAL